MKTSRAPIPPQWQWHHRALLRLHEVLERERSEHGRAIRTPLPEGGADLADVANDETAHDTLLAEISHEDAELHEVEAALDRLRHGTYGICEATGDPIAPERLRAVPWARLCQTAAARLETGTARRPR